MFSIFAVHPTLCLLSYAKMLSPYSRVRVYIAQNSTTVSHNLITSLGSSSIYIEYVPIALSSSRTHTRIRSQFYSALQNITLQRRSLGIVISGTQAA
jgi:hypothetical protein